MSVTIFGILNLGFGLLGLLSVVVSMALLSSASAASNSILKQMNDNPQAAAWNKIATPVSGVASVALLAAGIGLLLLQNWGRILSLIYSVYSIVFTIIGCVIALLGGGSALIKIGTTLGSVLSLVYPILLIVFMLRPNVVAAMKPAPPVP